MQKLPSFRKKQSLRKSINQSADEWKKFHWHQEDDLGVIDNYPITERMVGLGFRCWLKGYENSDMHYWRFTSQHYQDVYGMKDGLILSTLLGSWVRSLYKSTQRPIQILPVASKGFSYDEVMAISMIAACQHSQCPAMRACVFAVTEQTAMANLCGTAEEFAQGLRDAGQILQTHSIASPLAAMCADQMSKPN